MTDGVLSSSAGVDSAAQHTYPRTVVRAIGTAPGAWLRITEVVNRHPAMQVRMEAAKVLMSEVRRCWLVPPHCTPVCGREVAAAGTRPPPQHVATDLSCIAPTN